MFDLGMVKVIPHVWRDRAWLVWLACGAVVTAYDNWADVIGTWR